MKGPMPDAQDEAGRTELHQAAVKGDVDEVVYLLSSGANPNTQDAHLQTPVMLAAERGVYGVVKALAEHDATDINLQDSFGRTSLHWCAKNGDVKLAEALLGTKKADVNISTTGGDTALHWACCAEEGSDTHDRRLFEERSLRVAEALLGAGANVRAKNDRGETPIDLPRNEAILALLRSAALEQDEKDEQDERDEAAQAERARAARASEARAKADTAPVISESSSEASGKKASGAGARTTTSGWPATQKSARSELSSKQGATGGAAAGVGVGAVGTKKKKMVIKLKKRP